jgi:hypothetical protein
VRIRSRVKGWAVLPRFTPVARVARVARVAPAGRVTRAAERTNRLGPAGRAAALRAPADGRPEDSPERAAQIARSVTNTLRTSVGSSRVNGVSCTTSVPAETARTASVATRRATPSASIAMAPERAWLPKRTPHAKLRASARAEIAAAYPTDKRATKEATASRTIVSKRTTATFAARAHATGSARPVVPMARAATTRRGTPTARRLA